MTIFRIIVRKMLNTRWLVASWLIGMLITVSLVSVIPIYTNGLLQNLLIKNIESQQVVNSQSLNYPGGLTDVLSFLTPPGKSSKYLYTAEKQFNTSIASYVGLPVLSKYTELDTVALSFSAPGSGIDYSGANLVLTTMTDLDKHIKLVSGQLPDTRPIHNVYEALAPVTAIQNLDVSIGETLTVKSPTTSSNNFVKVKIVGEFEQKPGRDPYWAYPLSNWKTNLFIPDNLFRNTFITGAHPWLGYENLYSAFDYHQTTFSNIPHLLNVVNILQTEGENFLAEASFPMTSVLPRYIDQAHQLKLMMWAIDIPVMIMLLFYMLMISKLIIDRERTEIAVLHSRGASRRQIFLSYLIEVGILGLVSFAVGPIVSLGISEGLGASNGFLEFVGRTALPVKLDLTAYVYSLCSAVACLIVVMIPVIIETKSNIVSSKQRMARSTGQSFWHKYFLDAALLLVAGYGWFAIQQTHSEILNSQMNIYNGLKMNPLSFVIPALFVIGAGLVCLRFYPWLVRLVQWVTRRRLQPAAYIALNQVGRSPRQYHFLMLFFIMTIAVGTFSASVSRTINTNLQQQIQYSSGANINLQEQWVQVPNFSAAAVSSQQPSVQGTALSFSVVEPPFARYSLLPGVAHAARVFTQNQVQAAASNGSQNSQTELMAIDPADFAQTAWFKPSLLPYYWWGYLNLLSSNPKACLISPSLAKMLGVKLGDTISLQWQGSQSATFEVYGIIGYWPSWNPYDTSGQTNTSEAPSLVVANLSYVQIDMGIQPYHVWLKLKPDATVNQVYTGLEKAHIPLLSISNTQQQIDQMKSSPFIMSLNGSLTLGFVIAMLITLLGFLLYWLLTLSARKVQFGVFRAMGLSLRRLVSMLIWEQLLTSGVACVLGGVIGYGTSKLFVTQFALYFSATQQVPPFQVIFKSLDGVRIYSVVLFMLCIGIGFIWWMLSRLRMHQAIKLGED